MRFIADDSLRVLDDGHALVGGSPTRVMRLSARGRGVVESLLAGAPAPATAAEARLVGRLVQAGMFHPVPEHDAFAGAITFVVPTTGRDVSRLLDSLRGNAEVIVVEDTDRLGPAAARNRGWRRASGDVVVFIDDDCTPTDGWLSPLLAHFADDAVAAVAPRVVASASDCLIGRYEEARSPLDLGTRPGPVVAGTRVSYVPSTALAVRRSALAAVNGFDERLRFGEDVDLVWRLTASGGSVRYEPAAIVEHPARGDVRSWLRQRFDYGTSAAPLANRHSGALAPLRISGWSTLAWTAVAAGHAGLGVTITGVTTALLPRRLTMLRRPWPVALRLAGLGHLFAGRQIADALIRAWWPLSLFAAVVSRRARRAVLSAAFLPPLFEWFQRRPRLNLFAWIGLRVLDDVAYGAGVWAGCIRERTIDPLVPRAPALFALRGSDAVAKDDRRGEQQAPDSDRPDHDTYQ